MTAVALSAAHKCNSIVSSSLFDCTCILLTLLTPHPPTLLTPLPQSIPPQKPATSSDIRQHHPLCFTMHQQSPGNRIYRSWSAGRVRGRWERRRGVRLNGEAINGKMGRGQLWDGSQSNYKQRCNPGFSGGTKSTFQWSVSFPPPIPSCFFYLCMFVFLCFPFFLLLPIIMAHTTIRLFSTLLPPFPPAVCLSWLHERRYRMVSPANLQSLPS